MAKNTVTAKSTPTKAARAPRTKKPAAVEPAVTVQHAEMLDLGGEVDPLAALMAELGEITGTPAEPGVAPVVATDKLEVVAALDATPEGVVGAANDSTDEVTDVVEKAAGEDAPETKPAKTATPRKYFSDKVERLKDRMGASLGEYTVLTLADADVDEDQLKARMEETIAIIKGMNKKQQARAGFLIEFLSGKKAKLNEVLERVLTVLHTDGVITTGKEGNVLKNLLARPYSEAAARAMGGNTIGVYHDLKLIVADGKGRYLPNPDSLLLMKVNSMLFSGKEGAAASVEPVKEVAKIEAAEPAAPPTTPAKPNDDEVLPVTDDVSAIDDALEALEAIGEAAGEGLETADDDLDAVLAELTVE